jgi:hypothetical protein
MYVTDNRGERMVMHQLYSELYLRGYNGNPYTQQIIDWFREKWLFIQLTPYINCKREDGTESEWGQSFCTTAELIEIRGCAGHYIGKFEDYGEAEIEAIRFAIHFI